MPALVLRSISPHSKIDCNENDPNKPIDTRPHIDLLEELDDRDPTESTDVQNNTRCHVCNDREGVEH